jgi:uncharacterized lipoprotein YmbA
LQQTLITNLSKALPGRVVAGTPMGAQHDTLNVTRADWPKDYWRR